MGIWLDNVAVYFYILLLQVLWTDWEKPWNPSVRITCNRSTFEPASSRVHCQAYYRFINVLGSMSRRRYKQALTEALWTSLFRVKFRLFSVRFANCLLLYFLLNCTDTFQLPNYVQVSVISLPVSISLCGLIRFDGVVSSYCFILTYILSAIVQSGI
jgi:uncharacterized membrane protein YhdT